MGLFDASTSASGNVSQSSNYSNSTSSGATYGSAASAQALANMREANAFTQIMWEKQAEYNSREAQKTRDWQERLANTTYQRTVQDMIKAGVNPILAAGAGLSADSVSSGATANVAGATGQALGAYPDSINSSQSHAEGQSSGSGWSSSESGLTTFLTAMGQWVTGAIDALSSSQQINIALGTLGDWAEDQKENYDYSKNDWNESDDLSGVQRVTRFIKGLFGGRGQNRETRDKIKSGEMAPHSGAGHKF